MRDLTLNEAHCSHCGAQPLSSGRPAARGCHCSGHEDADDADILNLDACHYRSPAGEQRSRGAEFIRNQNAQADAAVESQLAERWHGFGGDAQPLTEDELTNNAADMELLDLDAVREQEATDHRRHMRRLRELGLSR